MDRAEPHAHSKTGYELGVIRRLIFYSLTGLLLAAATQMHAVNVVAPMKVPLSAEHWHALQADSMGPKGEAQFLRKEGFPQGLMVVKAGSMALDGLMFRDGTIEFDFKPLSADMPGLQFRVSGPEKTPDGEEMYLRMFGEERASDDGIQYAPIIHGFMLWNTYPEYQNQAPLVNGWNHIRVVVSGRRMKVYVNRSTEPVLSVGDLESRSMVGALHLRGPAVFANLVVDPGENDGLSPQPEIDPTASDSGIVRHWEMSNLQPIIKKRTPAYSEMPVEKNAWRYVDTERGGLLNLNRQYTMGDDPASLGWLRFNVSAKKNEVRRVSMGWIGHAWVFVNGKMLTAGENFYEPENERRDPDGRMSFANASFDIPLQKGSNEIAIALFASVHDDLRTRTKYGWGIMMRFAQAGGLILSR